jgi:hypothetical protein
MDYWFLPWEIDWLIVNGLILLWIIAAALES